MVNLKYWNSVSIKGEPRDGVSEVLLCREYEIGICGKMIATPPIRAFHNVKYKIHII